VIATFSRDFGTTGNIFVICDIFPINLGSPFTHIDSKIDCSVIIYVHSTYEVSKLILILFWSIYLISLSLTLVLIGLTCSREIWYSQCIS